LAPWPDWTERVFAIAGSQIDFASVHAAYAPVIANDLGWDPRTVYRAMVGAPQLIEQNLAEVSARLRLLAGRRIPIAMTEWGPLFSDRPSSRFFLHCRTLGSGLYTASVLAAMVRSPDVDHASLFKITDIYDFLGAIGMSGGSWTPRPAYLAITMFTSYFGTELVDTQTDSPVFDSPTVGWVDATGGVYRVLRLAAGRPSCSTAPEWTLILMLPFRRPLLSPHRPRWRLNCGGHSADRRKPGSLRLRLRPPAHP
jgi:alpha-N-arabinofuranosidase